MKELSSLSGGTAKESTIKSSQKVSGIKQKSIDFRPLYAVFATLVLYLFTIVLCQKYPIGNDSVLIGDLEAQYGPFLALMRSKLLELNNVTPEHLLSYLTYSFKLGLGKNFASTFGYYLASPFNLIYLLVDETQINAAILWIIVLKLSLSSGFMCLFLKSRIPDNKSLWPVLFGIMYAFSLYSQAFMLHIMWLDGYMLLPLILYFTEKFIKKQNYIGLVFSLLVLFVSNYYIAYMAGIASFLYLCVRLFANKTSIKKALGICLRYVFTAAFTAMITAVMLVPVGLDTISNADKSVPDYICLIYYSPLTLIHMLIQGESEDFNGLMIDNYPFLFICIPVTMLMILYFISPVFKGRDRKIHAFCVLGAFLSTLLYPLDKAWQVFDDPNWFWHRQSFVFLPLFLIISIKTIVRIKEVLRKDIIKVMAIMFLFVAIDYSIVREHGLQSDAVLFNLSLVTAYSALLAGYGIAKWPDQIKDMPKMLSPLLSGIICFELVFVGPAMNASIETLTVKVGDATQYADSIKAESEFGTFVKSNNAGIGAFRADTEKVPDYTIEHYVEDGECFYGNYNGVEFFNSNSNKNAHRFMKQLGMQTNYNYFAVWHTFSCPSIDSFFSVGSVSARNDISFYQLNGQDTVGTGLNFYSNENALPLAFAADKDAMDFDFYRLEKDASEKNYFLFQNDWYKSMFSDEFEEDFFVELDESITGEAKILNGDSMDLSGYTTNRELMIKNNNAEKELIVSEGPRGFERSIESELKKNMTTVYRSNASLPILIEYEFKAVSDDELYCSLVTDEILDGVIVYVNGVKVEGIDSCVYYSQLFRLGSFEEGEDVKVTFLARENKFSYLNIRFAYFDNEKFSNQIKAVDKNKVNVEEVSDGYARFSISELDSNDMVLTTIPAEDGWQLYIDGAPAEYRVYQNALIAFDVPFGNHTAELVFTAPGLKTGAMISCLGVVLLAAFIAVDKTVSKKKKQ